MAAANSTSLETLKTAIFDHFSDAIVLMKADNKQIIYANPAATKMFGFSRDLLIGQNISFFTDTDFENLNNSVDSNQNLSESSNIETENWHGDVKCLRNKGGPFWCCLNFSVFSPTDSDKILIATFRDINEAKAEKQRLTSLDSGLNSMAIVSISDSKGDIIYANEKFCELSGYSRSELIGQNHRILKSGHHPDEFFVSMWKTILKGTFWQGEVCNRKKDGSLYWVESSIFLITNEFGEKNYMSIRFDITKRKVAEQRLIETNKMTALGQMAAAIAHEINNPLTLILTRSELLLRRIDTSHTNYNSILADLKKIEETGWRISKIIHGLKTISRGDQADSFALSSSNQVVEDAISICAERFRVSDTDLQIIKSPDFQISCRATQLSQVLLNLLNNAFDAIQDSTDKKWVKIEVNSRGPEHLNFSITDSGKGIPKEVAEKMMEPFFTTKGVGKGTGLGLSISKEIANDHGGSIIVDSTSPNTRIILEISLNPVQKRVDTPDELTKKTKQVA